MRWIGRVQERPRVTPPGIAIRPLAFRSLSRSSRRSAWMAWVTAVGPCNAASSRMPRARSSSCSGHKPSLRRSDSASSTQSDRSMSPIVSERRSAEKGLGDLRAWHTDNQGRAPLWQPSIRIVVTDSSLWPPESCFTARDYAVVHILRIATPYRDRTYSSHSSVMDGMRGDHGVSNLPVRLTKYCAAPES